MVLDNNIYFSLVACRATWFHKKCTAYANTSIYTRDKRGWNDTRCIYFYCNEENHRKVAVSRVVQILISIIMFSLGPYRLAA